jgi:hypothetical protein
MAKKLTSEKARKILHDKSVHGKPLTEKQRKFFGAIAGGAEPYKAQIGTMLTALPSNMMDRLSDALGFPQKAVTKLVTGKYQTPSEAMNIQSPAGAIAADVLLDPLTFIGGGAGASKAAKAVRTAGKTTSKAAKKVATKMDRAIYPTRTYRIETPKGNQLSYKPSELAKKVQKKGDWTTSNLEDLAHYAQHRGLLEGKDVMLTEYKVPFWKKNIKADKDVVALKESQGTSRMEMNPNEFIVPRNNFLYPRRTTAIKGVPEHLLEDPLYNKYSMPMSYRASNYSSQPIKYIEDQLNAVTGHRMPLSTTISELRNQQPVRMETWKQPQFAPTEGVGKFKRFEEGGWLDRYNDMPQAQNGIEGIMGGLTDIGFNYNGAWNGPSMQMGGSLPGAVGFMYARTQSPAPSNGPYAKKTKASAQNGQEMKYYQEGLDFKPKTISQDGSEIPVDPMGYWNPENVGNPVIIPSTDITMQGVDQPLIGISDTGDVQYMEPGEDYEFDGEYVTEYPVAKGGVSVNNTDAQPLKKLDQLLNFTNYNKPTKGGWLDKYQ